MASRQDAAQFGIIALLNRGVEGIHVDVNDFSHHDPATILFCAQKSGNVCQSIRNSSRRVGTERELRFAVLRIQTGLDFHTQRS